jgi:hypothetical protein
MRVLDVGCIPGFFSVEFTGENLSGGISASGGYASGVYFYCLESENKVENRKRLLFRKLKIARPQ